MRGGQFVSGIDRLHMTNLFPSIVTMLRLNLLSSTATNASHFFPISFRNPSSSVPPSTAVSSALCRATSCYHQEIHKQLLHCSQKFLWQSGPGGLAPKIITGFSIGGQRYENANRESGDPTTCVLQDWPPATALPKRQEPDLVT